MPSEATLFGFKRDEVIFHQGESSDRVAFIVRGAVEITRMVDDKPHVAGTVEAGEFVGQIGAIIGRQRSETIRSIRDNTAVEFLSRDEFIRRVANSSESAYDLIQRLGQRLRATSRRPSDVAIFDSVAQKIRAASEGSETATVIPQGNPKQIRLYPARTILDAQTATEGILPDVFPFIIGRKPDEQELEEARNQQKRFADFDRRSGGNRRLGGGSGAGRRRSDGTEVGLQLDDTPPYRLSRLHFSIQKMGSGNFIIRDLGSALGTQVNDDSLGVNFPRDFIELRNGDNKIIAGGPESPFVFQLKVA